MGSQDQSYFSKILLHTAVPLPDGPVAASDDGPSASHVPEATLREPPRAVTGVLALKSTGANHLLAPDISSFSERLSERLSRECEAWTIWFNME